MVGDRLGYPTYVLQAGAFLTGALFFYKTFSYRMPFVCVCFDKKCTFGSLYCKCLEIVGTHLSLQDPTKVELDHRISVAWRKFWALKTLLLNRAWELWPGNFSLGALAREP